MTPTPAQLAILRARFPSIGEPALRANAAVLLANVRADSPKLGVVPVGGPTVKESLMVEPRKRHRTPKPKGESESRIQQRLIRWWDAEAGRLGLESDDLMAFPLQGKRTRANGARMKAEGMRAGTPDMLLTVPRGKQHGLWIELKTPTGRVSPSQHRMLVRLERRRYAAFASYGFEAAVKLISGYLAGDEYF